MTSADLRLNRDQEKALREADDTGCWYPRTPWDREVGESLVRHGLFWPLPVSLLSRRSGYGQTAAGRDWLALHPTEVAR